MTKSEASTIRGIALAPLMNGARTSAMNRLRPSTTPRTTPARVPSTKPSTASSRVTAMVPQIEPCELPSVNQMTSLSQIWLGIE